MLTEITQTQEGTTETKTKEASMEETRTRQPETASHTYASKAKQSWECSACNHLSKSQDTHCEQCGNHGNTLSMDWVVGDANHAEFRQCVNDLFLKVNTY